MNDRAPTCPVSGLKFGENKNSKTDLWSTVKSFVPWNARYTINKVIEAIKNALAVFRTQSAIRSSRFALLT